LVVTRIEDLTPEEMARRAQPPAYVEATSYVQNAQFLPSDRARTTPARPEP
jgi:hypothetical protein